MEFRKCSDKIIKLETFKLKSSNSSTFFFLFRFFFLTFWIFHKLFFLDVIYSFPLVTIFFSISSQRLHAEKRAWRRISKWAEPGAGKRLLNSTFQHRSSLIFWNDGLGSMSLAQSTFYLLFVAFLAVVIAVTADKQQSAYDLETPISVSSGIP